MKQAWNTTGALARQIMQGRNTVSEEELNARLDVCSTCEARNESRCGKCDSSVEDKAALATEDCPLVLWPKLREKK